MATEDSLVVMRLNDWLCLYASWLKEIGYDVHDPSEGIHIEVVFDDELIESVDREDDRSGKVVSLFPLNKENDNGKES